MPSKILKMHELLKTNELLQANYPIKYREELESKLSLNETFGIITPGKRARSDVTDPTFSVMPSAEVIEQRKKVITHSNESVISLLTMLKTEVHDLLEIVGESKMWIQLNIPRIEDGNNFGVSIQEETVAELSRAEDAVIGLLDSSFKYLVQRARLVSKVLKHPEVEDYLRSLVEVDEKELLQFRICFTDLKNNYQVLYDVLLKNMEKLRSPRGDNAAMASMY